MASGRNDYTAVLAGSETCAALLHG